MKTLVRIFFLVICQNLMAQELPILSTTSLANPEERFDHTENGNYAMDTNNERDQYVGLWQYSQDGVVFQLKIEKKDMVINKIDVEGFEIHYNYFDELILRYRLVKNNTVLFDNLNEFNVDPHMGYATKQSRFDFADGRILDRTRNVIGSFKIKKANTLSPKLIFTLERFGYQLLNESSYYDDGEPLFSIPRNGIEMVRVQ